MESMEIKTKQQVEKEDIAYIHKKAKKEFEILSRNSLLLTGANGFLGYYFIKAVLAWNKNNPKKAITLYALSNFSSGIPQWLKEEHKNRRLVLLKKDITTVRLSPKEEYNYIIHAASIASPTFYRLHPIETINANVQGLYRILDYLIARKETTKSPVKGLLYFSSSEIYGDPTKGNIPTPEDYRGNVSCTGPRACYDESKRFCETLCVNYAHVHSLPIKSARPFNNYGPGLKITDRRVIPDFAKDILENRHIIMYSDGKPSRTFCYVTDAIIGYIKILVTGKSGEAYNIGVDMPEISIYDLAVKMTEIGQKFFNYSGRVQRKKSTDKQYLTDNPQRRCPQIKKAKNELGYNPEITLEEGLIKVMQWYNG